jgi:Sortilin, neurotensin receptor 3,
MQRYRLLMFVAVALGLVTSSSQAPAQMLDSSVVSGFRWRTVGPANFMGRVSDVAGIPGPSKTLFVAAAGGGIWKSMNNGITWRPVFDDKNVISMGMLAIAPSDTMQVWAGTGEPNSRNTIEPGAGVYKSTDGGITWKFVGLEKTQHIGRIVVHPTNPNIVYVAALGPAWKAGGERGLYKTEDGGVSWKLIKAGANAKTGFIDVALDPSNPNVIYASSWERYRTPYSLNSGGPGSGLWKSTDAGATWTEIKGSGYPEGLKGRIGISVARSNPNIVYALTEACTMKATDRCVPSNSPAPSGLYRSTDAGKTWTQMNHIDTRPFYYSQVRADPKNPDRVYFSSTQLQVSNDGGKTTMNAAQGVHVDDHALWIDPNDPERWVLGNDGGIAITYDRGGNFYYPRNLALGQFYEISYDYAIPYNVCSGAQDNGAWCGPSRRNGVNTNSYWRTISGGDGFYTAQDPTNPNLVWGESQNAGIQQTNLATGERGRVNKPSWNERYHMWEDSIAIARGDVMVPATKEQLAKVADLKAKQKKDSIDLSIRYNWNSPYFLSPHNPRVFYLGGSRVLKSLKGGEDLFPISPDLSKQIQARMDTVAKHTGGITLDLTGAEAYGAVVTLAESPLKPGFLLAGTDDGNLWITHNDGGSWENLSSRVTGLPSNDVYVSRVEASHFDTLTFYVAYDNHRWNDFTPYLYMTTDGGRTFRSIVNNLPSGGVADFLHVIREDPQNRDLLFVGTSLSTYASIDRGKTWSKFASGLPSVPVYDLQIHPRDHELMAATHGRSLWVVDIAALEQLTPKVVASTYLFKPKTAYQWGEGPQMELSGNGNAQAVFMVASPPMAADIVYQLAPNAPTTPVRIAVLDASGDTISSIVGASGTGIHHVSWNFQGRRPPGPAPEQTPSQRRDSILLRVRAPAVLDSLRKAGYDTTAINTVRQQVATLLNPPQPQGFGGRGGRGAGGQPCERPLSQWDQFCARPAETTGGGRGGRGGGADTSAAAPTTPAAAAAAGGRGRGGRPGRGGAGEALDPVQHIWSVIGMNAPAQGGGRGRGGGGGGFGAQAFAGTFIAGTGDYLVVMNVGGKTYKELLRVERVSGSTDSGSPFGEEEERDGQSPAVVKKK